MSFAASAVCQESQNPEAPPSLEAGLKLLGAYSQRLPRSGAAESLKQGRYGEKDHQEVAKVLVFLSRGLASLTPPPGPQRQVAQGLIDRLQNDLDDVKKSEDDFWESLTPGQREGTEALPKTPADALLKLLQGVPSKFLKALQDQAEAASPPEGRGDAAGAEGEDPAGHTGEAATHSASPSAPLAQGPGSRPNLEAIGGRIFDNSVNSNSQGSNTRGLRENASDPRGYSPPRAPASTGHPTPPKKGDRSPSAQASEAAALPISPQAVNENATIAQRYQAIKDDFKAKHKANAESFQEMGSSEFREAFNPDAPLSQRIYHGSLGALMSIPVTVEKHMALDEETWNHTARMIKRGGILAAAVAAWPVGMAASAYGTLAGVAGWLAAGITSGLAANSAGDVLTSFREASDKPSLRTGIELGIKFYNPGKGSAESAGRDIAENPLAGNLLRPLVRQVADDGRRGFMRSARVIIAKISEEGISNAIEGAVLGLVPPSEPRNQHLPDA